MTAAAGQPLANPPHAGELWRADSRNRHLTAATGMAGGAGGVEMLGSALTAPAVSARSRWV